MTLALYGKSRKRQRGLIFAAFMAVMVAALAGLSVITSAFAHHTNVYGTATCSNGQYRIKWEINNSETGKVMGITNVSLSVGTWESGSPPTQAPQRPQNSGDPGTPELTVYSLAPGNYSGNITFTFTPDWSGNTSNEVPTPTVVHVNGDCGSPPPKLKVVKDVVTLQGGAAEDDHDFDFSITPTTGVSPTSFTLDDNGFENYSPGQGFWLSSQVVTIPSGGGTYTIVETQDSGWDVHSISCTGIDDEQVNLATGTVVLTLENGDDVTCTFKNKPEPPSRTLRVCKEVEGNNNGIVEGGTFTITVSGQANFTPNVTEGNSSCKDYTVADGEEVTVTETGQPAGWSNFAGFPSIELRPAVNPGGPNTSVTVQVSENSCGPNHTSANESTPGYDCQVLFVNKKSVAPPPSVAVDKSNTSDGTPNLGEPFDYKLKFTVTNGPTTSDYAVQDQIPANFTVGTVSPDGTGSPLHCTKSTNLVSCTLNSGAATGDYTATIPVTVNGNSQCGPVINDVFKDSTTSGNKLDSDTVNITGCGSVTFDKKNGVIDGQNIKWDIEITNSSVVAGNITIYDPGTSLGSETCSNTVSESPADTYYCELAGSSTAHLYLLTPLPQGYNAVCDSIHVDNTASIAGNYQSSDTAEYDDTAEPDSSCFVISKHASDVAQDGSNTYWDIDITNNTDATQEVFIVDAGAKFVGVANGTCPGVSAGDDMSGGIVCSVAAGQTMTVHVSKAKNLQVCEGSNDNSALIYLGRHNDGTPLLGSPEGGSINYRNESQCTSVIQLCKVWRFNTDLELSDGSLDFGFNVSDSSEVELVTINATEGEEDPSCVLLEVQNGVVKIDELPLGAGWATPDYETDIPGLPDGSGNHVEFWVDAQGCYSNILTLVEQDVQGLLRSIFNVQVVQEGKPLCTVTFFNEDDSNRLPSGNLRVEKYLDINGDGDANDAGEGLIQWEITIDGDDVTGQFTLNAPTGVRDFLGLETGDLYDIAELAVPGYHVTNATINNISQGAVTSVSNVPVPNGGFTVIRFYNQPLGGITVNKATWNVKDGIETKNLNDDDGWKITVKSVLCGISTSAVTDVNGNATFSNLPLCNDYVVAEDLTSPGAPGYSPVTPASVSGVAPTVNGYTQVNFVNETRTTTPPCTNCNGATPTPTTPPPTATPTNPTDPTATPTTPATTPASPTSVSTVQGERTPGPGASATPIAPSTGGGLMGGTSSGANLLLIVAGLLALTSGMSFVALGRRNRR